MKSRHVNAAAGSSAPVTASVVLDGMPPRRERA